MHALATSRSGWTHLALAISFTGASAFSRASHTRGHLNSSALAGGLLGGGAAPDGLARDRERDARSVSAP